MRIMNCCRIIFIKIFIFVVSLVTTIALCSIPHFLNIKEPQKARFATDMKYILFWKTDKPKQILYEEKKKSEGQTLFVKQQCKYINCFITHDKKLLWKDQNDIDAVVFDIKEIMSMNYNELNITRSTHQFIFHSQESPVEFSLCNSYLDYFFNWTWTYKLDSDISQPFFNIYDANSNKIGPRKNMTWITNMDHKDRFKKKILNKNKAVACIITTCELKVKYETFIKELKNELIGYNYSLDLYGPCGEHKCTNGCYKTIENNYYFNLVLDDTFSDDYVTKKIMKAMTHLLIPIIWSGTDYTNFLPPGSYISAQGFDIKKLGAIIDFLIKHPKTYGKFFDWKNHYYYLPKPKSDVCELCTKLNEDTGTVLRSYTNIRKWWNPYYKGYCRTQH